MVVSGEYVRIAAPFHYSHVDSAKESKAPSVGSLEFHQVHAGFNLQGLEAEVVAFRARFAGMGLLGTPALMEELFRSSERVYFQMISPSEKTGFASSLGLCRTRNSPV